MKNTLTNKFLAFLLVCCPLFFAAATAAEVPPLPQFRTVAGGVSVGIRGMGNFYVTLPRMMSSAGDYSTPNPVGTVVNEREITATYVNGNKVSVDVDAATNSVLFTWEKPLRDIWGVRFDISIPAYMITPDSRYDLGGAGYSAIKSDEKGRIAAERTDSFTLVNRRGIGARFNTPRCFYQFSDNRRVGRDDYVLMLFVEARDLKEFRINLDTLLVRQDTSKVVLDAFGQVIASDYAGKISDVAELRADAQRGDPSELVVTHSQPLDMYGGLLGSKEQYGLEATGFFYITDFNGGKTLVSPEGNLFFQVGVCALINSADTDTFVKGREDIFQWLPQKDEAVFAEAWRRNGETFSFYVANWIRKYERAFDGKLWAAQARERLRNWGFNSLGAWSAADVKALQIPYTDELMHVFTYNSGLKRIQGAKRSIFDPFDPNVEKALQDALRRHVLPQAQNPYVIGYFIGNEENFEDVPRIVLGLSGSYAIKQRLVQMLRDNYADNIGGFNQAWGVSFNSFEALENAKLAVTTDAARADMKQFYGIFLDAYYGTIHEQFRKVDPNHLLIGNRWLSTVVTDDVLLETAGRYLDALSINMYAYAVSNSLLERIYAKSGGRPIILSEWSFTSTERGLYGGPASRDMPDQRSRGLAYRSYAENAVSSPYVISVQWFKYIDFAATGRGDAGANGESGNYGLVDVLDRPYEDFIAEVIKTNGRIYDVMLGSVEPFRIGQDRRFAGDTGRNRQGMSVARALAAIPLDGTSSAWPQIPATLMNAEQNLVDGKAPSGTSLGAGFNLCWDAEAFYVMVRVKSDSAPANSHTGRNLWMGDCVELFVGTDVTKGGALLAGDLQFLFSAGGQEAYSLQSAGALSQVAFISQPSVGGDGYVIQVRIPWAVIGIEPKPGAEFLFDIGVDFSADGKKRDSQLMWSGSADNARDRTLWGKVRLY